MDALAMNKLSYGLFVITAQGERQNGCITNTVGQVTTSPNRITLAVNKGSFTHDLIIKSGEFNVSVLSEKCDFSIFQRFGFQSGRDTDKFQGFTSWAVAENGIAYITEGVNAVISAKVCESLDLGTHTLFIADVTDALSLSDTPSATYAYYHAHIKPKPEAPKTEGGKKKTVWRCSICGYEEEVEELPSDFVCPLCLHPASDFEKVVY